MANYFLVYLLSSGFAYRGRPPPKQKSAEKQNRERLVCDLSKDEFPQNTASP